MRRLRRYGFLAYEIASIEAPIASMTAIARVIESTPEITSKPVVINVVAILSLLLRSFARPD